MIFKKLVMAMNASGADKAFKADGTHYTWNGDLIDDTLVAPHPNYFISSKNTNNWIHYIESFELEKENTNTAGKKKDDEETKTLKETLSKKKKES